MTVLGVSIALGQAKAMASLVAASALVVICAAVPLPVSAATPSASYVVTQIPGVARNLPSYAIALNSRGDVLGQVDTSAPRALLSTVTVILGSLTRPPVHSTLTPRTSTQPMHFGSGISGRRRRQAFAVRPSGRSFVWTRLAMGALNVQSLSVARVSGNGDIAGEVDPVGSFYDRSVIWRAAPNAAICRLTFCR